MKNNLYTARSSKILWFIRRFGFKEIFLKPLRKILAPLITNIKKKERFIFDGKGYFLFYNNYNITWINERCVEIPVIMGCILNQNKRILEVGNVLSHYFNVRWDILDKYERGKGVINKDILQYFPKEKYDLIISISTFEHIGYDDEKTEGSEKKILKVIDHLKKNCLNKRGKIIFTIPIGYNSELDEMIKTEGIDIQKKKFLKKFGGNKWVEVTKEEAMISKYGKPYPYGNCVMIGEIQKD